MPRSARPNSSPPAFRALLCLLLLLPAMPFPVRSAARAKLVPPGTRTGLPDSVLAVIGSGRPGEPGREIGRARFARAWSQLAPPARPDSLTPAGARRFLDLPPDKEALGLMAARAPLLPATGAAPRPRRLQEQREWSHQGRSAGMPIERVGRASRAAPQAEGALPQVPAPPHGRPGNVPATRAESTHVPPRSNAASRPRIAAASVSMPARFARSSARRAVATAAPDRPAAAWAAA